MAKNEADILFKSHLKDIVTFASTEYILPETNKPIKLMPHQKRILLDTFTRDPTTLKFPYETIVYSAPKKSGKSEIESLVALFFGLTEPPYNEIYFLANDKEQSQTRGYERLTEVINTNPYLRKHCHFNRDTVVLPNKTTIKAIASDYAGGAGANQGLTLWDELWAYTSVNARRLYEEFTPVPTRRNSLRFIATYAGFEGESKLLWELYQRGIGGKKKYKDLPVWIDNDLYFYWDQIPRMPWQTPAYYERQRKQLPINAYNRLHRNMWVSATSSFIPPEWWDACVDPNRSMATPGVRETMFVGVDIATKRDSCAIVAVYWDKDKKKVILAHHHIWQPTQQDPLDFESTVEAYLLQLHQTFRIGAVYYDPSQFVRSSQLLRGQGIPLTEFTQVPTNLTSMTQILYELVRGRNLVMYHSAELREQNLDCSIIDIGRGMRIAKEKASQKIDAIVALAMACQAAWDGCGLTPLPDSQPENTTSWRFGSMSPMLVGLEGDTGKSRWRI